MLINCFSEAYAKTQDCASLKFRLNKFEDKMNLILPLILKKLPYEFTTLRFHDSRSNRGLGMKGNSV